MNDELYQSPLERRKELALLATQIWCNLTPPDGKEAVIIASQIILLAEEFVSVK